jgi:hypothetical protein
VGDWLEQHWADLLVTSLFTLLGIVAGIVISYLFYRWGKQQKKPRFHIKNYPVLVGWKDTLPDISIHYRGHGDDIENLSMAHVLLWNNGNVPILAKDMPKGSQLAITAKDGCTLVGQKILKGTNDHNRFRLTSNREKTRVAIDSDFMNGMDGVLIQVIHTGKSSDDLRVEGAFIGAELQSFGMLDGRTRRRNELWDRGVRVYLLTIWVASIFMLTWGELTGRMRGSVALSLWSMFGGFLANQVWWWTRRWRRHRMLKKLDLDW